MISREDIERHLPGLRRMARALGCGGDPRAAEDVVREAVRRALLPKRASAAETRRGEARFKLLSLLFAAAQTALPDEALAEQDFDGRARLNAALAALPRDQREMLLLVTLERLSVAQAAAVLHVTPERALHRLTIARDRFAALMAARRSAPPTRQRGHLRVVK